MDITYIINELRRLYPSRDWLEQCERFCWNVGWVALGYPDENGLQGYPSAQLSYQASHIISTNPDDAQPGDTVWFEFSPYGHNGIALGHGLAAMASSRGDVLVDLGQGMRIIPIGSYPTRYLGNSRRHGSHPAYSVEYAAIDWGQFTTTQYDGIPGENFWKLFQRWAQEDGYDGPVDGEPGIYTWAAIQRGRARWDGYDGPDDGVPGEETWKALQRAARHGGYQGPIDGVPGKNTYRGLATLLNRKFA